MTSDLSRDNLDLKALLRSLLKSRTRLPPNLARDILVILLKTCVGKLTRETRIAKGKGGIYTYGSMIHTLVE